MEIGSAGAAVASQFTSLLATRATGVEAAGPTQVSPSQQQPAPPSPTLGGGIGSNIGGSEGTGRILDITA